MTNRQHRRALQREQHRFVEKFPVALTLVPETEFPLLSPRPVQVWRSRQYLVQLYGYDERTPIVGMMRLSVCRTKLGSDGRWEDGLTWDELQAIKREVGFGDWYAVEVYPPDAQVVNAANMRHLWLLPVPLPIGF